MSKVKIFTLLTLAIVTAVTANSCTVKDYKEKLLPACDLQDIQIKWPNYEDQTSYYRCVNVNSARLLSCPSGKVFVYVYQECRSCEDYIPAVECRNLRTQNTPICLPIDGGNNSGNGGGNGGNGGGNGGNNGGNNNVVTYPTPRYPEQTTIPDVNTSSTSESSEQPDDNSSTVEVSSTQPTPAASSSPSTESTDIPQPSSPPPTPESVSQEPSESTSSVEVPTKEPSAPPSPDDVTTTPFPTPPSIG